MIMGGTNENVGELVYTTKITKMSVFVVDMKGEKNLKRKVHLKKMEGMKF